MTEKVQIAERYVPLLETTATSLIAERCREVAEGVNDGAVPRHVVDLLIERLTVAIEARAEIVAAAGEDEGYLSKQTLRLVGPVAVETERHRLQGDWEMGGDDLRALADYTERLADLSDYLVVTRTDQ